MPFFAVAVASDEGSVLRHHVQWHVKDEHSNTYVPYDDATSCAVERAFLAYCDDGAIVGAGVGDDTGTDTTDKASGAGAGAGAGAGIRAGAAGASRRGGTNGPGSPGSGAFPPALIEPIKQQRSL